ncbi:hypothetical protein JOQ06_030048 [Pogonophryne albipinna]|uniref:C-type lectin domain-containing protein n=1 Tax=Pogonophryne albipinna TaxID=1090488 RepID=A0AAD6AXE7_9TELE|nr:hypothetical protein JOQ06_030048 [Pogonophryne albipinna]
MEEIYANVDDVKSRSSRSSTIQEGPRRLLRASVLGLGLLSVFLLAGLIGLAVHYHNSVGDAAAELSTVKANLSSRLHASDQLLSSVTEERDNLTERLHASDQLINQLKANLTEKTREVDMLQCWRECFMEDIMWTGGQPDNGGGSVEEDCAYINPSTWWDDLSCWKNLHWICEK